MGLETISNPAVGIEHAATAVLVQTEIKAMSGAGSPEAYARFYQYHAHNDERDGSGATVKRSYQVQAQ
jgi:hypothetical protein